MIALVSLASPLSPRLTNARHTRSRKRAIVGEGQDRIDRRAGVDDRELAGRQVALARRRRGRRLDVGGDAGELGLADGDEGLLVGEHLLAERGEQAGELLVVGRKLLLLLGVEIGAAALELLVEPGDQRAAAGR